VGDKSRAADLPRVARSIVANWAALISGFLVTFFLSPFVVSHLGTVPYGTWVILGTLNAYMALLDLGLRGAVTRYVARDHALHDDEKASANVSAALWLRLWIAFGIMVFALAFSATIARVFNVPGELASEASSAFMINAGTVGVMLVGGVFGAVVASLNRHDLLATTGLLQTAIRTVGTIVLLRSGYSLVALAWLECVAALVSQSANAFACFRVYPALRVRFGVPARERLMELARYSGGQALFQLFGHINAFTPTLLIGAMGAPTMVAQWAIGIALVEAVRQVVATITPVFMPLASRYDATGGEAALRSLLEHGTRLVLIAILPILAGLLFRGPTFIGVWMGPEFTHTSGQVLRVLILTTMVIVANSTGVNILFGLGRQRECLTWLALEAMCSAVLTAVFVPFGLVAVAWAIALPALIIRALLWTRTVCRIVGVPFWRFLATTWFKPLVAVAPFALACFVTDKYLTAGSAFIVLLQIAALLPIYAMTCAALMWSDVKRVWELMRGKVTEPVAA
jgi:O-antigen/teichoic acid export membrane protein